MKIGEVLNSIGSINSITSKPKVEALTKNSGESFADLLKDAIKEVNTQQVQAYDAMQQIATGKVENLQEAMKQIEEAELSLKLGLEVKNKALAAYKQVMSMQV